MSGDIMSSIDLTPVVNALTSSVTPQNIVTVFATGVAVSLGIVLAWTGCKWVYGKFIRAVKGRG